MKRIYLYLILVIGLYSCTEDEGFEQNPFVVAFENQSTNYATVRDSKDINLIFSEPAEESGFVKVRLDLTQAEYGVDFKTMPEAENNVLTLPFAKGDKSITFKFENLIDRFDTDDQGKKINLVIEEINYRNTVSIQGYKSHLISFGSLLGGTVEPNIGGPNEPFQVYYDLSTGDTFSIRRDTWDLGFYGGDEFRVVLNGSIYMATKALDSFDIDAVNTGNIPAEYFDKVAMGTFDPENEEFIDYPNGDLNRTAIQEISVNADNNSVYLVNLGVKVGTAKPNIGSVAVSGESRGWKKVRILRQGNGYLLQYADLDSSNHQEVFIEKDSNYNFTHFSFDTNEKLNAQPLKNNWDLCFTVFTNVVVDPATGSSSGSYGFSDFVVNNLLAQSKAFMVEDNTPNAFENYTLNVAEAESLLENDQRSIGANWRSVFSGLYENVFFVLKDVDGNWYKIRFIGFKNSEGERGYPKFQYELIN